MTIVAVLSLTSLFIMVMCLLVLAGLVLIKRWSVIKITQDPSPGSNLDPPEDIVARPMNKFTSLTISTSPHFRTNLPLDKIMSPTTGEVIVEPLEPLTPGFSDEEEGDYIDVEENEEEKEEKEEEGDPNRDPTSTFESTCNTTTMIFYECKYQVHHEL